MKFNLKSLTAVAVAFCSISAFAAQPVYLTTHNNTDVESNAFVDGNIPSPYPTAANSTRKIAWNMVRIACFGHTSNGKCSAMVKMATNTPNPVNLGFVSMELDSGDISPKVMSANGYTLTVNGPGEVTLTKD